MEKEKRRSRTLKVKTGKRERLKKRKKSEKKKRDKKLRRQLRLLTLKHS